MIVIYSDGICEPNPGHACWAWIAFDTADGKEIARDAGYVGRDKTNNDAEYIAFGKALRWIQGNHATERVVIRSDSRLVVEQVQLNWHCNWERLQKYRDLCREIMATIPLLKIEWIRGGENPADFLTRIAYTEIVGVIPPVRH